MSDELEELKKRATERRHRKALGFPRNLRHDSQNDCDESEADLNCAIAIAEELLAFDILKCERELDEARALADRAIPLVQHKAMCYGLRNFEYDCDCGAYQMRKAYENRTWKP